MSPGCVAAIRTKLEEVVEAQGIRYLGTEYRELSAHALLFLVFRTGGLCGHALTERERLAPRRV